MSSFFSLCAMSRISAYGLAAAIVPHYYGQWMVELDHVELLIIESTVSNHPGEYNQLNFQCRPVTEVRAPYAPDTCDSSSCQISFTVIRKQGFTSMRHAPSLSRELMTSSTSGRAALAVLDVCVQVMWPRERKTSWDACCTELQSSDRRFQPAALCLLTVIASPSTVIPIPEMMFRPCCTFYSYTGSHCGHALPPRATMRRV